MTTIKADLVQILLFFTILNHYTVQFSFYIAGNVMVWDFTDTSFRPSIVLKAAHFRITSMEFLKSSSSTAKQQLLAAGDESGTLHVFEMPKSLVKPAHKEAIIMSAFLDREREVRKHYLIYGSTLCTCRTLDVEF
jgi:hypothetical protein